MKVNDSLVNRTLQLQQENSYRVAHPGETDQRIVTVFCLGAGRGMATLPFREDQEEFVD